jgi:hypothetical protein
MTGPPSGDVTPQVTDDGGVTVAWAVVILAAAAGVALAILAWGDLARGDLASTLGETAGAVAFATLGALIVRRAGNVFGWIMLGMAGARAFDVLASVYAVAGIVTFPGSLPAARPVGALAQGKPWTGPRIGVDERTRVTGSSTWAAVTDAAGWPFWSVPGLPIRDQLIDRAVLFTLTVT